MQGRKLVASKPCKHMPSNSWIPGSACQARKRLHSCHIPRYWKHSAAQQHWGRGGPGAPAPSNRDAPAPCCPSALPGSIGRAALPQRLPTERRSPRQWQLPLPCPPLLRRRVGNGGGLKPPEEQGEREGLPSPRPRQCGLWPTGD